MSDLRKPARWPELNERYRAEGWGQVAEAALGTYPENVEAQAREVARYAHAEIRRARSEYERVLALLAEAREALNDAALMLEAAAEDMAAGRADEGGAIALRKQEDDARATLSRIDDALAAEPEAKA